MPPDFLPGRQPGGAETRKCGTFRSPAVAVPKGTRLGRRRREVCEGEPSPGKEEQEAAGRPGMRGAVWRIPAKR